MSQANLSCPKCHGDMEQGYTLDLSQAGAILIPQSQTFPGQWVRGVPQPAPFDFGQRGAITTPTVADRIPIATFRCTSCGFLESYARDEFRPTRK